MGSRHYHRMYFCTTNTITTQSIRSGINELTLAARSQQPQALQSARSSWATGGQQPHRPFGLKFGANLHRVSQLLLAARTDSPPHMHSRGAVFDVQQLAGVPRLTNHFAPLGHPLGPTCNSNAQFRSLQELYLQRSAYPLPCRPAEAALNPSSSALACCCRSSASNSPITACDPDQCRHLYRCA